MQLAKKGVEQMQGSGDEAIILAIFRLRHLMKKHTNETQKIKMSM